MTKVNLLDFNEDDLKKLVVSLGAKSFHGTQIFKWIHQLGVETLTEISNLSVKLRDELSQNYIIALPILSSEQISNDGTIKWAVMLKDLSIVEMVFIPEDNRGTLCISSQVGCAINCSFCLTGKGGFVRNLDVSEIIGQLRFTIKRLSQLFDYKDKKITNLVFMGMGEPLLNFDNVVKSLSIFTHDNAYGLSKYRVTVSTSGIPPLIDKLSKLSSVSLTVSLHAANNALRDLLVPINMKYSLEELIGACKVYYQDPSKRKITFAYIMLDHVNDSIKDALDLVKLISHVNCKVNLIPFNCFKNSKYKTSSYEKIKLFQDVLIKKGIQTTIRKTRGDDIQASCGQLSFLGNKSDF